MWVGNFILLSAAVECIGMQLQWTMKGKELAYPENNKETWRYEGAEASHSVNRMPYSPEWLLYAGASQRRKVAAWDSFLSD